MKLSKTLSDASSTLATSKKSTGFCDLGAVQASSYCVTVLLIMVRAFLGSAPVSTGLDGGSGGIRKATSYFCWRRVDIRGRQYRRYFICGRPSASTTAQTTDAKSNLAVMPKRTPAVTGEFALAA